MVVMFSLYMTILLYFDLYIYIYIEEKILLLHVSVKEALDYSLHQPSPHLWVLLPQSTRRLNVVVTQVHNFRRNHRTLTQTFLLDSLKLMLSASWQDELGSYTGESEGYVLSNATRSSSNPHHFVTQGVCNIQSHFCLESHYNLWINILLYFLQLHQCIRKTIITEVKIHCI
jgi:hypothetical protein